MAVFFSRSANSSGGAIPIAMIRKEVWLLRYRARFFWSKATPEEKEARKAVNLKERKKIMEDIGRGYFSDIKDLKKHNGKVTPTSTVLDPPATATIFPKSTVYTTTREKSIFPVNKNDRVSLVGLSFRDSGRIMVNSWVSPLREAFPSTDDIQVVELSWVESGILTFLPVRHLFLMCLNSSKVGKQTDRAVFYGFGDSYDLRHELYLTNRLTGYMFLVDRNGRVRWRASGIASPEEASSLVSCTSSLLQEAQ